MNVQKTLFTTLTASLLLTTNAQALEVIKGEDINYGDPQSHATLDRTIQAEKEFLNYLFPIEEGTQNYGTEGFESLTGSESLKLNFGDAGMAILTGDKNSRIQNIKDSKNGQYSASGENYWYTKVTPEENSTFRIDFTNNNVAAIGFYTIDCGDFGAELALKVNYSDGSEPKIIEGLNTQNSGSAMYVGVVSPEKTISHVEFIMTGEVQNRKGDAFAFDNFTVATTEQLKARSAD